MPSAKELRDELRSLRKEHVKPISKLRVADISAEIQKLKGHREETPLPAATASPPIKMSRAAVETIQEAKASEFPVRPHDLKGGKAPAHNPKKAPKAAKAEKHPKNIVPAAVKKSEKGDSEMKAKLAKLLELI